MAEQQNDQTQTNQTTQATTGAEQVTQQPAASTETAPATPAPTAPTATTTPAAPAPKPAVTTVTKVAQQQPAKQTLADAIKSGAPVVTNTKAPAATVTPTETATQELIAKAQAEASSAGRVILQNVLDYMQAMDPKKPVNADIGSRYQVSLYRAITRTINNLGDDFDLVFTAILRLFADNGSDVFAERFVFRFMDSVNLSSDEIKGYQRLLNLLINTADPKGRASGLKMTDFNKTLEFGLTEEGRARVLTYFNK